MSENFWNILDFIVSEMSENVWKFPRCQYTKMSEKDSEILEIYNMKMSDNFRTKMSENFHADVDVFSYI